MKKELEHFNVDEWYGGSQKWFSDAWMKIGGCGAVTACDLCIYLAKTMGLTDLYPGDPEHVTMEDYISFGMRMKPYLSPRMHGINRTETYIDGLNAYLADTGCMPFVMEGVSGETDIEKAVCLVKEQIDRGFPVPYLMLLHRDKKLDDYMWHWFLLNGYEEDGKHTRVKAVSYGKAVWMDLRHLWRTDRKRKGGFVLIRKKEVSGNTDSEGYES